jgi:hypothetical protein
MTHLSQDKHNYIVVIQWKRVRNICAYILQAVQELENYFVAHVSLSSCCLVFINGNEYNSLGNAQIGFFLIPICLESCYV